MLAKATGADVEDDTDWGARGDPPAGAEDEEDDVPKIMSAAISKKDCGAGVGVGVAVGMVVGRAVGLGRMI